MQRAHVQFSVREPGDNPITLPAEPLPRNASERQKAEAAIVTAIKGMPLAEIVGAVTEVLAKPSLLAALIQIARSAWTSSACLTGCCAHA